MKLREHNKKVASLNSTVMLQRMEIDRLLNQNSRLEQELARGRGTAGLEQKDNGALDQWRLKCADLFLQRDQLIAKTVELEQELAQTRQLLAQVSRQALAYIEIPPGVG